MLLALLFLPVALVVITVGLPLLIFMASIGVMGLVIYSQICTQLSGCTSVITNESSSSSSSSSLLWTARNSYRYNNEHPYYYDSSRRSSPPPSPTMMVPEYRISSSSTLSPLRFRYSKSNMATCSPPSPTSSMHNINVVDRWNLQQYEYDTTTATQLKRRRRVHFA